MTVLDIRGTHGSGKSHIVHSLMKMSKVTPITGEVYGKRDQHMGYCLKKWDAAIIGKYENVCGGCDGVGKADEICRRVRMLSKPYSFVILEGILVAHTFKRYHELANEIGDYRFLFLNTPLSKCIGRVLARRRASGNSKPLKTDNIRHDYKQIWIRTRAKLEEAGHYVRVLDWRDPMSVVLEELSK